MNFLDKKVQRLRWIPKQCNRAGRAFESVFSIIGSVEGETAIKSAHWQKNKGLDALWQIRRFILGSSDLIGSGVRKHFRCESLGNSIFNIVGTLTEDERHKLQHEADDGQAPLVLQLEQLLVYGRDHDIFCELEDVMRSPCRRTDEDRSEEEEDDSDAEKSD